jgi:erythromycin esterase-like protein
MAYAQTAILVDLIGEAAHPLIGDKEDYGPLLAMIGDARLVLLGEASHGTHEFYRERAQITKRLITEKGFTAVAVEADWPDAYRVNRYVRGEGSDVDSVDALSGFKRFPAWMWRNADVLDFVGWLRTHNDDLPANKPKVGFYRLLWKRCLNIWTRWTRKPHHAPAIATRASSTSAKTPRLMGTQLALDLPDPVRSKSLLR